MDTRYADAAECAVEQKPLESLASAAQRINSAQVQISRFIDRFHGPQPEKTTGEAGSLAGAPEPTIPHSQNLNRLFAAIDRLEARIDTLNQIG